MRQYIYQQEDWANFFWNNEAVLAQLVPIRNRQGKLVGKMETLGFQLKYTLPVKEIRVIFKVNSNLK